MSTEAPVPPASPAAQGVAVGPLSRAEFAWRAGIAVAMTTVAVVVCLLAWKTATAMLLLFAAGLVSVFLLQLSNLLASRSRLSPSAALVVVVVLLTGTLVALGRILAPAASMQAMDLLRRLPEEVNVLRDQVAGTTWGGDWLGVTQGGSFPEQGGASPLGNSASAAVFRFVATLAGQLATGSLAALLVIPAGLFFAAQPDVYFNGALRLLPSAARAPARAIAGEIVERLGWWLIGQAVLMALLTVATGMGLWALSVPLALILALLRGGLNIIPNVGPIVAVVPGLIIAAGQGGQTFFRVAVMYAVLQLIDNNLLTPVVNRRTVQMPPMLLIGSQLFLGVLFGVPGIILAAPLVVVGMVLVQRLYIERILGEDPGAAATRTLPEVPSEAPSEQSKKPFTSA